MGQGTYSAVCGEICKLAHQVRNVKVSGSLAAASPPQGGDELWTKPQLRQVKLFKPRGVMSMGFLDTESKDLLDRESSYLLDRESSHFLDGESKGFVGKF